MDNEEWVRKFAKAVIGAIKDDYLVVQRKRLEELLVLMYHHGYEHGKSSGVPPSGKQEAP